MSKRTRWPLDAALEALGNEPTVGRAGGENISFTRTRFRTSRGAARNRGLRARPLRHRGRGVEATSRPQYSSARYLVFRDS
jgi:hypothetical protein